MSRDREPKWPSIIETRRQKRERAAPVQVGEAVEVVTAPTPVVEAEPFVEELFSPGQFIPAHLPMTPGSVFDSPWDPENLKKIKPAEQPSPQQETHTPIGRKTAQRTTPTTDILVQHHMFAAPSPREPATTPTCPSTRGFSEGDSQVHTPLQNLIPIREAKQQYQQLVAEVEDYFQNGQKDSATIKAFVEQKLDEVRALQNGVQNHPKIYNSCLTLMNRLTTLLMDDLVVSEANAAVPFKTPLKVGNRK